MQKGNRRKTFAALPPPHGTHPRVVCAKIDFTVRYNKGIDFPSPERMRELNTLIKKFWRAAENKFALKRAAYGFAYCDELGGNNDNPHAHGVYVGPFLPNGRKGSKEPKPVSELWEKITRSSSFRGSFIVSLKYADSFSEALYHAVKIPCQIRDTIEPNAARRARNNFPSCAAFSYVSEFLQSPGAQTRARAQEMPQVRRAHARVVSFRGVA
jgi:hypothetical protein